MTAKPKNVSAPRDVVAEKRLKKELRAYRSEHAKRLHRLVEEANGDNLVRPPRHLDEEEDTYE